MALLYSLRGVHSNMTSSSVSLDTLPAEVVQILAASGPLESAIALIQVNKALRAACYDSLLFHTIINKTNDTTPLIRQLLTIDTSVPILARYAVALSKANGMAKDATWYKENIDDLAKWAPQVAILDKFSIPAASISDLLRFISEYDDVASSSKQALSFCLAARLLSADLVPESFTYWNSPILDASLIAACMRGFDATPLVKKPNWIWGTFPLYLLHTRSLSSPDCVSEVMRVHSEANRTLGIFAHRLRAFLRPGFMYRRSSHLAQNVPGPPDTSLYLPDVPSVHSIPFHSFMKLPAPFSDNAATAFNLCHLEKMTSREFVEDGNWIGYYGFPFFRFDPAIQPFQFKVTKSPGRNLKISVTGTDAFGDFMFHGWINQDTGGVEIERVSLLGSPVLSLHTTLLGNHMKGKGLPVMSLLMTPFGIFGTWGERYHSGWLWLWKEAWSMNPKPT